MNFPAFTSMQTSQFPVFSLLPLAFEIGSLSFSAVSKIQVLWPSWLPKKKLLFQMGAAMDARSSQTAEALKIRRPFCFVACTSPVPGALKVPCSPKQGTWTKFNVSVTHLLKSGSGARTISLGILNFITPPRVRSGVPVRVWFNVKTYQNLITNHKF